MPKDNDLPIRSSNVRKIIGVLTEDARMPTKRIASRLRCSQQLVSYLIGRITSIDNVRTSVLVDTSRIGLEHVLVGLRYRRILKPQVDALLKDLSSEPSVTLLAQARSDVDLLVEFAAPNLSWFNKQMRSLLRDHTDIVDVVFVLPIMVKRSYPRSYLNRSKRSVRVVHGDRPRRSLNDLDRAVLDRFSEQGRAPLTELSRSIGAGVSSIRSAKQQLERDEVIRGYTLRGDVVALGIPTSWLLLKLPGEGIGSIDAIVTASELDPHIVEITKTLGSYHLLLRIEDSPAHRVLRSLRTRFDIERSLRIDADAIDIDRLVPDSSIIP